MPDSPATVFAGMNIGVVVLGALVGVFAFGEATTKWNRRPGTGGAGDRTDRLG